MGSEKGKWRARDLPVSNLFFLSPCFYRCRCKLCAGGERRQKKTCAVKIITRDVKWLRFQIFVSTLVF